MRRGDCSTQKAEARDTETKSPGPLINHPLSVVRKHQISLSLSLSLLFFFLHISFLKSLLLFSSLLVFLWTLYLSFLPSLLSVPINFPFFSVPIIFLSLVLYSALVYPLSRPLVNRSSGLEANCVMADHVLISKLI